MKAKNLFFGALTCLAFAACSNDDEPTLNSSAKNPDQYVVVNIVTSGETTRADYVNGTAAESAVDNAWFIFFKGGAYVASYNSTNLSFKENNTDAAPQIEQIGSAIVVLDEPSVIPDQMIAILNSNLTETDIKDKTLTQIQSLVLDCSQTTNFIMSNSVWEDNEVTPILQENLLAVPEDGVNVGDAYVGDKAVNVYVERVLARVDVLPYETTGSDPIEIIDNELTQNDYDGTSTSNEELVLVPTITGYHLSYTTPVSYVLKDITDFTYDWDYVVEEWNNPTNKRSHWAKSVPESEWKEREFGKVTYTGSEVADLTQNWTSYCQENTLGASTSSIGKATKLVVTAKLQKKDVLGNLTDIDDLIRYQGTFYTVNGYLKQVAKYLQDKGWKYAVADGTSTDWYSMLKVADPETAHAYEICVGLTDETLTVTDANDASVAIANVISYLKEQIAWGWQDGKCYYFTEIKHINGKDAIVRNHLYQLQIGYIKGLGTPVYDWDENYDDDDDDDDSDPTPEPDDEDPIDPEKPTEDAFYIAAKLNVLKWRVVSVQEVEFGK